MSVLTALVPLVPAVVAAVAAVLLLQGYRLLRSDGMGELDLGDLVLLHPEQRRAVLSRGPIGRLGGRLVPALRGLIGPSGVRWLHQQVRLAGSPDGATVDSVLASMGSWLVAVSPAVLLFAVQLNVAGLLLCGGVVAVMPLARLARARRLRRERMDRDLPDFLDILSVTVAAGVGFRPSLARVSGRFGGPLAEEITLTLNQILNGATRRQAFHALRQRNESEAMAQFVTAFLQAEELGAPLVETLRQIALDMRRTAAQRGRRRAARVAPRVTLVTVLVLLPGAVITIFVGFVVGAGNSLTRFFGS